MLAKLRNITYTFVAGANMVTIVLMLLCGYSDRLSPNSFPSLSQAGLVFPVFLVFNLGFLVFWTFFHLKGALIPVVGFLLAYAPIRVYAPFNVKGKVPENAIKILSFNIWQNNGWTNREEKNPILQYLEEEDADIVLLQEAEGNLFRSEKEERKFKERYPYQEVSKGNGHGDRLVVYSKFEILRHDSIPYESMGNHSEAYYLDVRGDTMIVINNHFESNGFTEEEKESFKAMVKGDMGAGEVKDESKSILYKLAQKEVIRSSQVDSVAKYIEEHGNYPIVCGGDFNDTPISYTRRRIANVLNDAYVDTGFGPGISYHRSGFYVRIDYLMYSNWLNAYACSVDRRITNSDHYPIKCWFGLSSKR